MALGDLLEIILIIYGLYLLVGVLLKPDFFWNYSRMQRRRKLVGDEAVTRMYIAIALIMIVVGGLGVFNVIGG